MKGSRRSQALQLGVAHVGPPAAGRCLAAECGVGAARGSRTFPGAASSVRNSRVGAGGVRAMRGWGPGEAGLPEAASAWPGAPRLPGVGAAWVVDPVPAALPSAWWPGPLASSCRRPVGSVPPSCEVRERSPSPATQLLVGSSVHLQQMRFWPPRQRWSRRPGGANAPSVKLS